MKVSLNFDYEWSEDELDRTPEEAVELATDLLYEWLVDGNTPEIGVNATVETD